MPASAVITPPLLHHALGHDRLVRELLILNRAK
jgi:hypothetical protein